MATLQKRALYGLIFGVVWAVAVIVVFIIRGASMPLMRMWGSD